MISTLSSIALQAGVCIMDIYNTTSKNDVQHKGDGSPVTIADAQAESIIIKGLSQHFPHIPVVAEESIAAGLVPDISGGTFFLVDPLDGTKEFISKNDSFTVNIALIENGIPVVGIVYAPALAEIYTGNDAGAQMSATKNNALIGQWQRITVREFHKNKLTIVSSKSHLSEETQAFINKFSGVECISTGSSLKFCLLAKGKADLYPRHGATMQWDTAAADAVLRAAGGSVINADTHKPLLYGDINTNGRRFENPWFIAQTQGYRRFL